MNSTSYFNPLPRERENGVLICDGAVRSDFNPLPRERENGSESKHKISVKMISIHSLVRGRTLLTLHMAMNISHFNPLPRERENRPKRQERHGGRAISIHSLVRGRTI